MPGYLTAEKKLRAEFNEYSESDRQIFFSKLIHAVNNDDFALFYANCIVEGATKKEVFHNVKFGAEIYNSDDEETSELQA